MTLEESIAILALAAKQVDCPCYVGSRWQVSIPVVLEGDWPEDMKAAAAGSGDAAIMVAGMVPRCLADFELVLSKHRGDIEARLRVDHIE
jgi:hypothetical protein